MYHFINLKVQRRILLLLIIWGGVISCKSIYKAVDGVNKTINFKNKDQYLNYYSKKYGFDTQKIFFMDNDEYGDFMRYMNHEKVAYFYGITINDSTKIDDAFLNEDNTCSGRVLGTIQSKEIYKNVRQSKLAKFKFENMDGIQFDNSKGKSIIFLLSTKFGNNIIKDIKRLVGEVEKYHDPEMNYFLISVDGPNTYNGFISTHQP